MLQPAPADSASLTDKVEKAPIVITSRTLSVDNKNNLGIFEGSVVARTKDIAIYADKMTVFYDNSENRVRKIHAEGNVKVTIQERALFSDDAIYFEKEQKIIFTGNPKAVDSENVISGTKITFHIKDERAEVEGSRVILRSGQGLD